MKLVLLAVATFYSFILNASARTYYLPDYQKEFIYGKRVEQSDTGTHTNTPTCSTYGYYSSADRPDNSDCTLVKDPIPGLKCYSCTACSSTYTYDDSNCSGDYIVSGSSCGGKYAECICDPTKYKASSGGIGCSNSEKVDLSQSCTDKSSGETYYKCVDDPCAGLVDNTTEWGCESYYSQCPSMCEVGKLDPCEGLADNETDLGCDKYYDECPSKCELGKTCTPNDCTGYTLTSCPSGAICESCTVGCGDDTSKYKEIGCAEDAFIVNGKCKLFTGAISLTFDVRSSGKISLNMKKNVYRIDWGDESVTEETTSSKGTLTSNISHTYSKSGSYTIKITGNVEEFRIGSVSDASLTNINQLDLETVTSYSNAFSSNCSQVTGSIPALPMGLIDGSNMFRGCKQLTGSIPTLPESLENGYYMFYDCYNLTGDIPELPRKLTIANHMFHGCDLTGNISQLPNNLEEASYMFYSCTKLTGTVPQLPKNLRNADYMFGHVKFTGNIPELPSSLSYAAGMFYNCRYLSGDAPTKPAELNVYSGIFEGTKVTNDGSWSSGAW